MAARLGMARGPGCAGGRYLFLCVRASVVARIASIPRKRCEAPCATCAPTDGHAVSHRRSPRLRCGRPESGGAAVDSDFSCRCVLWWQLRAGMDVEPAPRSANPQQRIPDARNRTQPGMDHRRRGPGDSLHRWTGTRRHVSFALGGRPGKARVPFFEPALSEAEGCRLGPEKET